MTTTNKSHRHVLVHVENDGDETERAFAEKRLAHLENMQPSQFPYQGDETMDTFKALSGKVTKNFREIRGELVPIGDWVLSQSDVDEINALMSRVDSERASSTLNK